jgi:multicomponent Na+:H+ antiporter subunit E
VAKRVLNPQLPISPVVIEFESRLKGDLAKVVLANSITLTPGTLTVDIRGDTFFVHCLAEEYAKDLLDRKLENMVFWVFFGSGGREAGAGGTTQGSFPA